ncbi:MAG TPA: formyltransferase family protein [Phycisphaerae bacterium]|nr:formyltransferase family protein [Phycisphaerae bacterium]HNU45247.1 formyltransferase family protein [Phycisphaerae bacterium]
MTTAVNRRIAFFGGKPLSARCLRHLYEFHRRGEIEIVAVLTRGKGERGWWSGPGVPEMYETAEELGLRLLTHADELLEMPVDLGLSVLHYCILPARIVGHPRHGFLNLHCAPLPHYRGCNVGSHAILNGEARFGATLHYMDEKPDHGPVIAVEWFDIPPQATARELMTLTEEAAYRLFVARVPALLANDLCGEPQERIIARERIVSYYYPRTSLARPGMKEVDLHWPAEKILRHVRALDFPPFEPAYALLDGRKVYLSMSYRGAEPIVSTAPVVAVSATHA